MRAAAYEIFPVLWKYDGGGGTTTLRIIGFIIVYFGQERSIADINRHPGKNSRTSRDE